MSAAAGLFITLEGGEGAGKSTLARALGDALTQKEHDVVLTREPGGSPGADAIRDLIVRGAQDRWEPMVEALLIAAARADHLATRIRPALARGAVVVCDRYLDSTRAYQAFGRGLPEETVEALARLIDAPHPDATLLLDLPPEAGLARSRGEAFGEDRYERMDLAFHERVRAGFLTIARREPQRVGVIDATLGADAVLAAAKADLFARLGLSL